MKITASRGHQEAFPLKQMQDEQKYEVSLNCDIE